MNCSDRNLTKIVHAWTSGLGNQKKSKNKTDVGVRNQNSHFRPDYITCYLILMISMTGFKRLSNGTYIRTA